jgi:hypothetical protein
MTIPAITALFNPVASLKSVSSVLRSIDSADNTSPQTADSTPNSSKMMESVLQSLSKIGSNPPPQSQNDGQTIPNFIQSLVSALQSQQGDSLSSLPKSFQGNGKLEQSLQSLIDQIGRPEKQAPSSVKDLQLLEQNANQLFAALGAPAGDQSLTQFLNNFKQSMAGNGPIGNILSTKA